MFTNFDNAQDHDQLIAEFRVSDFSLSNPQLTADPYPYYDKIRRAEPIHHSRMYGGSWLLFRYADVKALLCDPRLTNDRSGLPLRALPEDERAQFADMLPVLSRWLAFFDGGEHTRRRRRLNWSCPAMFSKRALRGVVRREADRLLDAWEGCDRVDLVTDFARPLPAVVIAKLLGAPVCDSGQLAAWSDDIAYLFGASDLTIDDVRRAQASIHAFESYLRGLAADVAKAPGGNSVMGRLMCEGGRGFRFDVEGAAAQCMLLMFAGLEPTRYLIGNAGYELCRRPGQRRALIEDPSLLPVAVEEFLRHTTPVQYIGRMAATSFTYKGHRFEEGQLVLPYVGSANRDPAAFDHADRLDLHRRPNPHLAFGLGPHTCVGATLVRQQTQVALATLFTRYPSLAASPEAEPVWNTNLGFHGLTSLTVDIGAERRAGACG